MEKLTQESLDYLVEFVENKDTNDWNVVKKDLNSNYHIDTIRKSFAVGEYSGYSVYKFMQDKMEKDFYSDEEVIKIEKLRDKEYKERVKLQDANREKRKVLRDFSRIEALQEYIDMKLDEREPKPFKGCPYKIKNGNEASCLISDLHCGNKVDNIFNYYDLDILRERMEELSNKIISFCKRDKVDLLHAEFIGDLISGIIHGATIAEAQEDVIDQIIDVSDIVVDFIKSLRKEIPCVKTYFAYGNHARISQGKSNQANKTNYERLVPTLVRKDLRNTDIKVMDGGYEDFVTYKLRSGKLIVATHGTNDNPAIANKNFSKLLEENVYEVHMGHYHNAKELDGSVVNGSVMGSDDYAIQTRKNQTPTQILKVYYNDFDTVTYKLGLK